MVVTKYLLFQALVTGGPLSTSDVRFKVVTAIEREEGSVHAFTVTGLDERGLKTSVSLRTVD